MFHKMKIQTVVTIEGETKQTLCYLCVLLSLTLSVFIMSKILTGKTDSRLIYRDPQTNYIL